MGRQSMRVTKKRSQRGDTIIEVLIAMSVLSLVLVTGYSISTRSLNGIRVSQERGEALKIAESQVEMLHALSARAESFEALENRGIIVQNNGLDTGLDNKKTFSPQEAADAFCFNSAGLVVKTNAASPAGDCTSDRYTAIIRPEYVAVTHSGVIIRSVSYQVDVGWDRAGGGERQVLSLAYKVTVPDL